MVRPQRVRRLGWSLPVPHLAGPKTLLRPWHLKDAPALVAAWRDPVIRSRLRVPEPADEASAVRWISQRERAWADGWSMDLAVTDPSSGAVIGEVGLSGFDPARRAARWSAGGSPRVGAARVRASEAVRLVVDWALSKGLLSAVMAEVAGDNPASMAVARRAGLRRVDAPQRESGESDSPAVLVFARERDEA